MGHDGCWHTTTAGNEFSVTFQSDDEDLQFTPDQDDSWKLYALGALTLAATFVAGVFVGRML